MKKCLVFSLIFFAKFALSQVHDNFDDGNFTANPVWTGSNSSTDFAVVNNQLRSNSAAPSSSFYLSTPNALASNCVWEFYCNLQFATSGSNYADVYLTSDQQNLQSSIINGYFVRIGNTNDEICLYKRSGALSTIIKIIDGADGTVSSTNNNRIKIRVSRNSEGRFLLERDLTGLGNTFVSEGTTEDLSFASSSYFGFYVTQSTSSFIQKHFFDDVSVQEMVADHTPPKLLSAAALSESTIEVQFDEAVEETSAGSVSSYFLDNGIGNPQSVTATTNPARFILAFSSTFKTGTYTLTASGINDKSNNRMEAGNSVSFSYVQPYFAKKGDIVINEIFADPSPQIDLPGLEFIELWNTSSQSISLKDWKFSDPGTTASLPFYLINPGEYLILCAKADTGEFSKFGKVLGISPWPSLNNASDAIKLGSAQGIVIDSVAYSDTWYKSAEKKTGGWTLELINPKAVCGGSQNWIASTDPTGGTPGKLNSVYTINTSTEPVKLINASIIDSITIALSFNRLIDSTSAGVATNYSFNNGLGQPSLVKFTSGDYKDVELKFSKPISRGKMYEVSLSGITDCAGILIAPGNNTASFVYPDKILPSDIAISEILFNPRPGGADFVEIYNNSQKTLDLKELYLANIKEPDSIANVKLLTTTQLLFKPGEYLVLTTDPENVKKEYSTENPAAFLRLASIPSFNDDAGTVVLLSGETRIDQLTYTVKMHFGLIKDPEGVSLERVNFQRPGSEPGNFRSAAASVGYATPSYKNSQMVETREVNEAVSLLSKTFSPDNDGFEDALNINYHFAEAGLVANATIYNDKGQIVRRIAKNLTLAQEGTLYWDGLNEADQKAAVGVYLIYVETFDAKGSTKKYRKSCVLAAKL